MTARFIMALFYHSYTLFVKCYYHAFYGKMYLTRAGAGCTTLGQINVSLPSDGTTADVSDYNTPITSIVDEINGSLDNSNLSASAGIAGSKIADDGITASKIDWASTGANGGIWWEEVGRTTLGVAGDTISVTSIGARKYLKILVLLTNTGGNLTNTMRFNNDSGNNYALRYSDDGAAHTTSASQSGIAMFSAAQTFPFFCEFEVLNSATSEKLVVGHAHAQNTAGAGNVPGVREHYDKWANASDSITRVDVINTGTGDYAIGSEVIVLGHN